jgi:hypothetical protein
MAFSSVTAMLGNVGQANYGAANGFLDGLAVREGARKGRMVSINWGAWRMGMYARVEGRGEKGKEGVIEAEEGKGLLEEHGGAVRQKWGVMRMEQNGVLFWSWH